MRVLGLDIGGANLKAADNEGWAATQPFAIWKQPERLADVLLTLTADQRAFDCIAVTMTAELADCFETKSAGVDSILTSVERAYGATPVYVWQTGGEFVEPALARELPLLVAAANWHALATWLGRVCPQGNAILIDIGTTTTDIIPFADGRPIPQGFTDVERLQAGELVYTGVRRTPVFAVTPAVPLRDTACPLAAELFSNMGDVHLLLDHFPEEPENVDTPNGKPFTRKASLDRIARQLCCDVTEIDEDEILQICRHLMQEQTEQIRRAIEKVLMTLSGGCRGVLLSGKGTFLAESVLRDMPDLQSVNCIDIAQLFGTRQAEAACAMAVAQLASERIPTE